MEIDMPNWISNELTITGSAPAIEAVTRQLGSSFEFPQLVSPGGAVALLEGDPGTMQLAVLPDPVFALWNIIHPEEHDYLRYASLYAEAGNQPFWYSWNLEHWGTKWDVADPRQVRDEAEEVAYAFRTPWCPPIEALVTLSRQHPMLTLKLDWLDLEGSFDSDWSSVTLVNGDLADDQASTG
jgi:hypothetical protein